MSKVFSPDLLAFARGRANLTQAQLAQKARLSREQISMIENGNQTPRRSSVGRLAEALGVDPDSLYVEDDS
jgi:transcriptional regulator with XRE-family HTH domain